VTARDELQNAAGSYALNAMDAAERAEFEVLVAGNEQLGAEVTELTDTAVELGLSVAPVDPPASLRDSILSAVAQTPQLEPVEDEHELAPAETPAELKARSRWGTPLARLGAVAAAVALIVGLGFTVRAGIQAQSDMATASQINEIQAADDYQRAVVEVGAGGSATAVWSVELRRAALIVDDWKDLPAGSTYELWYMDAEGTATPAGTFDVGDDGSRSVVLAGAMDAGDTIGVTIEPAGGSETPSDQVVVVVPTA
jgi:anti-sigma-K factor RskA